MPSVNVNGTDLFYIDQGQGTPLVFVPGLGSTHELWAPQIEAFSKTHRIIAIDPRGNGQSGRLTGPVRTILDRQTDDLAALLEHLGVQQAVICGVSYGGVFTFHFVLRHPEKVRAIVIVDSFGDTRPEKFSDKLIMLGNFNVWANYLPPALLKPLMKPMWKRWPRAQAALMRQMDNWRAHEATLQRLAIMTAQHTPDLHQVQCPALGIVGDHTQAAVRFMQKPMNAIAGARLEVVHDSFDPTNLCQTETFNRLLADFLAELEANR